MVGVSGKPMRLSECMSEEGAKGEAIEEIKEFTKASKKRNEP